MTDFVERFTSFDTARWGAITAGSGTVGVSGGALELDEVGSETSNVAAVALKEALPLDEDWVIAVCVKYEGDFVGAYTPNLVGLYDSAAVPTAMPEASRLSSQRIIFENQGSSNATFDRWQYRFRNPSGTLYNWRNTNDDWSTEFQHSHTQPNRDNYCILALHHKVGSGIRMLGYGHDDRNATGVDSGMRLVASTDYKNFGSGTTDIDEVANSLYLVIGDPVNDDGGYTHKVSVLWAARAQVLSTYGELAYVAGHFSSSWPYEYQIREHFCPEVWQSNNLPLWLPADHHPDDSIVVAAGSDDFVQDPKSLVVGGTQYMVYARRISGTEGALSIISRSSPTGAWSAPVDMVQHDDTGIDGGTTILRFPELRYEDSTWWLLFNSEESGDPMKIYRASRGDASPMGAFGSIAKILSPTGVADDFDEDGVAQPTLIKQGATYVLVYAGYDASLGTGGQWQGGLATMDAIDGTPSRTAGPLLAKGSVTTTVDGAQSGREILVDDASGLTEGEAFVGGPVTGSQVRYRPTRLLSKSGNTLTFAHSLSYADGATISQYDHASIAPRQVRKDPSANRLELWGTVFKFQQGEEVVGRYVSGEGELDLQTATFVPSTDDAFPWVGMTRRPNRVFSSEENIGIVSTVAQQSIPLGGRVAPALPFGPLGAEFGSMNL